MTKPPSQILKQAYDKVKGTDASDAYITEQAKQTICRRLQLHVGRKKLLPHDTCVCVERSIVRSLMKLKVGLAVM